MNEAKIATMEIHFSNTAVPAHDTAMFVDVDYIEFPEGNVPNGIYDIALAEIRPPYLAVANNSGGLMNVQVSNNRIATYQLAMDVHNSSNMTENLGVVMARAVLVKK